MAKGKKADAGGGVKVIAQNKRARFDFALEDRFEAGLALTGSEVKSLRAGNVTLSDAYAQPRHGELWLVNCRIGEYEKAGAFGHEPKRDRKLLLKRSEIDKIDVKVAQRGYTVVPTQIYFKDGWAKIEIALARGRTHEDRREAIAERETKREMDRAMSRKRR